MIKLLHWIQITYLHGAVEGITLVEQDQLEEALLAFDRALHIRRDTRSHLAGYERCPLQFA